MMAISLPRTMRPLTRARVLLSVLPAFLLSLCLAAGPAAAQSTNAALSADTTRITFDEAIGIALDQNTTLKRAANNVRQAEVTLRSERFDWSPDATITSGVQRNFGRSFSQEEGAIVNQSTDFFTVRVGGSVSLQGLGLQNYSSMRSAEWESTASELTLERTRQDIVFQVMNRYITLVENREVLVVQREELEARRQQLRQIEEFVDAGSQPISALFEQQAAVAEAESNVLTAERDVQLSETRLIQTLRLDPMKAYDFQAPGVPEEMSDVPQYNLNALMTQAFDQRLDLRANRASVRAADSDITSTRSQYLPTLTFSADYNTNWSSTAPDTRDIPGTGQIQDVNILTQEGITIPAEVPVVQPQTEPLSFADILDRRRGGSMGVSLQFPLFDGFRREQSIEQAQVSKLNAEYALEDQKLQVSLEVREAYLNYQNAVKQLDATEKRLRFARQAREAAQERYNLGAASIVELTNANRTFVEAASQRIRARYNFLFQQKLIAYFVGSLNPSESLFN